MLARHEVNSNEVAQCDRYSSFSHNLNEYRNYIDFPLQYRNLRGEFVDARKPES